MKLSVVMSVFNGARSLGATLESIFGQTERDFEVVVIDDGSTDATPDILAEYARRDDRIRVLPQTNSGLTRALIRGCSEARAPIIARHDCGDRSHRERFAQQLGLIEEGHVLVSSAVRAVGPEGELLYVTTGDGEAIRRSLLNDDVTQIRGIPHHGSAMFRREAYLDVGGYRPQFRFAQDLDLWMRLARRGTIAIAPEVLYEAEIDAGTISAMHRPSQIEAATLAIRLRDAAPGEEPNLLAEAESIEIEPRKHSEVADAHYFIATCLLRQKDPRWRSYAARAVRVNPFHLRAWMRLLIGR